MSSENLKAQFNSLKVDELSLSEMKDINGGGSWIEVIGIAVISSIGLVFAVGSVVGYVIEKNSR